MKTFRAVGFRVLRGLAFTIFRVRVFSLKTERFLLGGLRIIKGL